tara:strand:+ start:360 stop:806 length:447 start_codon:yes stop_codon:yes gene_type:complete
MSEDDTLTKQLAERKEVNLRKRSRGRPKKSEVKAKTTGSRGKVGRPKGDAGIINEYKARMLASPKSVKVLETIFDAALDNEHKNQAAAWKLVMDRVLPVGAFEKEVMKDGGRNAIQINITGVGSTEVLGNTKEPEEDLVIDGDYEEQV